MQHWLLVIAYNSRVLSFIQQSNLLVHDSQEIRLQLVTMQALKIHCSFGTVHPKLS